MSGSPVISLRHAAVGYRCGRSLWRQDRYWALKDVSFDLHRGDVLGVVGKNGAGKSTLLKLLAGIILPDRGAVLKDGSIRASLLSLSLGFVPHLTGRENIILGGLLLGHRFAEIRRRMARIVDFSELGAFIDEPVKTYSSGMRARLGFSVAIEMEPDVLLIDEVLGVGDEDFRRKSSAAMMNRIGSGMTIVLATHNADLIRKICNRAVWIEHGESRLEGETATVLDAYYGPSTPRPAARIAARNGDTT